MAKEKAKEKTEGNDDIADRYEKELRTQLKIMVKKHQNGKISDKKMEKAYQRLVCTTCNVKACVSHPKTIKPDGYGDGDETEKLYSMVEKGKIAKNLPVYCVVIPPFIDSGLDGDYISDVLSDRFDEEYEEKGLVDISVQHLNHLKRDLTELSKYKGEDEIVALRHLIRAVSFMLRHGTFQPSTI